VLCAAAPAWAAYGTGALQEQVTTPQVEVGATQAEPGMPQAETASPQAETGPSQAEAVPPRSDTGSPQTEAGTAQAETGTPQVETETVQAEAVPAPVETDTVQAEAGTDQVVADTAWWKAGIAQEAGTEQAQAEAETDQVEAGIAWWKVGAAQGEGEATPSAVTRVAEWVAATGDNDSLPYAIIDKNSASLFLFGADGTPLAEAPVLIGVAAGDDATPGVGSKDLAEIGPAERTTPAGRFLAKYGEAWGGQTVLWVDYDDSVALHPIPPTVSKKEHRRERMLSPTPDDNRITFGCINVPKALYDNSIRPLFEEKGGYVYVLPDTRPLEDVFPRLQVQTAMAGGSPR